MSSSNWNVGDVVTFAREGYQPVHRKITEVRDGPAYNWRYCEANGTTYGPEYRSENSQGFLPIWGWKLTEP